MLGIIKNKELLKILEIYSLHKPLREGSKDLIDMILSVDLELPKNNNYSDYNSLFYKIIQAIGPIRMMIEMFLEELQDYMGEK